MSFRHSRSLRYLYSCRSFTLLPVRHRSVSPCGHPIFTRLASHRSPRPFRPSALGPNESHLLRILNVPFGSQVYLSLSLLSSVSTLSMPILIRAAYQLAPFHSAPILIRVAHQLVPFGASQRASYDRGTFSRDQRTLFEHSMDEHRHMTLVPSIVLQVSCLLIRQTS